MYCSYVTCKICKKRRILHQHRQIVEFAVHVRHAQNVDFSSAVRMRHAEYVKLLYFTPKSCNSWKCCSCVTCRKSAILKVLFVCDMRNTLKSTNFDKKLVPLDQIQWPIKSRSISWISCIIRLQKSCHVYRYVVFTFLKTYGLGY